MKKFLATLFFTLSTLVLAYENKENINGVEYNFKYETAPTRAISLSQMTTEIMLKLGLGNNMIGTAFLEEEIYPTIQAEYNKVTVIADKWPSFEQVIALNPDFVSGWEVALKKGVDSKLLAKHNINMFVPKSSIELSANLDTLFDDFREYGKIFNKEKEVEKYIEIEKNRLEEIKKGIGNKEGFTYFLYDSGIDKAFTVYEGFTTNLISMINGKNILSNKGVSKTWGETSWENVVAEDPDYIIVVDYSKGIREETDSNSKIEQLKSNPLTKNLRAVKNNKFIKVKLAEICPGIRNIDFFEKISREVYNK